jgi:sec-independent protein translocase protein TatC
MKTLQRLWQSITSPFHPSPQTTPGAVDVLSEEQESSPLLDILASVFENPRLLIPHINELRGRLFRVVIYLTIGSAIAFVLITPILEFLALPLPGGIDSLQGIDITESVGAVMRVALLTGFAGAFPFIVYEIWAFFSPGLKENEKRWVLLVLPAATVFFLAGMAFTYWVLLPNALPVLLSFMGLKTTPRPNSYFPFVVNLMFWMGVSFEFPLVILVLARLGLVQARSLANQWRIAVVIIAIVAAVITTTTDPANMALVMAPMLVLYFISVGLAYLVQRPKKS